MSSKEINLVLDLRLKRIWFDKIASGEKTHEFREVKPYFTSRIYLNGIQKVHTIRLRRAQDGVSLNFNIKSITIKNGKNTDLKLDKPVYDIELGEKK